MHLFTQKPFVYRERLLYFYGMWKGLELEFKGQHLILLPQKAIYWKDEKALIVADVHVGKVGHFRKSGIAIPKLLEQEELATLSDLIHEYRPEKILFLGDLFHSELNNDWNWLELWRGLFPDITMILVKGNHDILHPEYYKKSGFRVVDQLALGPFLFTHEPFQQQDLRPGLYVMSGHIHPGVKLKGLGRQMVTLSCFIFDEHQAVLPAFGKFTGRYCLPTNERCRIFALVGKGVVPIGV